MGDKNPRSLARLDNQKRAIAGTDTKGKKRAATAPAAPSAYDKHMRFRFNRVDVGSDWCLTNISQNDHAELIGAMAQIEGMKLSELIPSRCKREDVAGGGPNADAKQRAQDAFPDEHDKIHSLRISGTKRIWGLLYDHEFSVIWWDPKHEIWPGKRVTSNSN